MWSYELVQCLLQAVQDRSDRMGLFRFRAPSQSSLLAPPSLLSGWPIFAQRLAPF